MESGFDTSLDYFLNFFDKCFGWAIIHFLSTNTLTLIKMFIVYSNEKPSKPMGSSYLLNCQLY